MYGDSQSYYLAQSSDECDELRNKLEICKRALAWAWNNNTNVDCIDWDAFFSEAERI